MKNRAVVLVDTKNGERRIVPLPSEVIEMLARRPAPLREFFPGMTLNKLVLRFRRLVRRAGLSGVSFHTLRHTFASHAVMTGVDLYTLAKILGHRDIKMVQRYAHLAPAHLQAATDRAAKAIFAVDMPHQVPQTTESAA